MGRVTKSEFRSDLDGIIGEGRKEPPWLDRRVQEGYVDVATAILHNTTKREVVIPTVVNQIDYPMPANALGVVSVYDTELKKALIYIESENLDHYNFDRVQSSRLWSQIGDQLRIYPTPFDSVDLKVTFHIEPDPLLAEDSRTILPARWDNAVLLVAAHYAFLHLHEDEKAEMFFERFVSYAGARLTDSDIRHAPSMPITTPDSFEDLRRSRGI